MKITNSNAFYVKLFTLSAVITAVILIGAGCAGLNKKYDVFPKGVDGTVKEVLTKVPAAFEAEKPNYKVVKTELATSEWQEIRNGAGQLVRRVVRVWVGYRNTPKSQCEVDQYFFAQAYESGNWGALTYHSAALDPNRRHYWGLIDCAKLGAAQ